MSDLEIVKAYMTIPYLTRKTLIEQIKKEKREMNRAKILSYFHLMEDMLGHPIDLDSRKADMVCARAVVAYYLKDKGYTESEIARLLNKSFANIHVYCDQLEFEISHKLKTDRYRLYNKYKKYIEENEIN